MEKLADYRRAAEAVAQVFRDHGAHRVVDAVMDTTTANDTPVVMSGFHVREFASAVRLEFGEVLILAWTEWPDKSTRDTGLAAVLKDARARPPAGAAQIFDGARLITAGFQDLTDQLPRA